MADPVIAQQKPYLASVKQGRTYYWCACGNSATQPWCDGSHAGTDFEPLAFRAERSGDVLLCGCKHSRTAPYCDGSHNNLAEHYAEASAEEIAASANNVEIVRDATGKSILDGGCYVLTPDAARFAAHGTLRITPSITSADGAKFLSQYNAIAAPGTTPVIKFGSADVAIFVVTGKGHITIAGRTFPIGPETGAYIKPGEAFTLTNTDEAPMTLSIAVCPEAAPELCDAMPDNFDDRFPDRVETVDESKRQPMASRFYQVLVSAETSGADITQFVGEIPRSRAAGHHHLYEEAITILSGEGWLWTEDRKTRVHAGDVIFLPPKQIHSLECTDPKGMRLMGVFYPNMSPAINY